ncbi:MAG: hypothetical protein U0V74_03000 [Chitinophagales bacterium]
MEPIVATIEKGNSRIFKDRARTNILKSAEQRLIMFLCPLIPSWVTPDVLTAIGFIGSFIVAVGFVAAAFKPILLTVCIAGFGIQWFGDSLDGRIAYYRNVPQKWYGFSLDLIMDWLSTIMIGVGFYFYLPVDYKLLAFTLVACYGWAMLLVLIKYKLTGEYLIDSGLIGPTEFRIILCGLLFLEILVPGSLIVAVAIVNTLLFLVNCVNFHKLLQTGKTLDKKPRALTKTLANTPNGFSKTGS